MNIKSCEKPFPSSLLQLCPGIASHLHTFVLNTKRFLTFKFLKRTSNQSQWIYYSRMLTLVSCCSFVLLQLFSLYHFVLFILLPIFIFWECDAKQPRGCPSLKSTILLLLQYATCTWFKITCRYSGTFYWTL